MESQAGRSDPAFRPGPLAGAELTAPLRKKQEVRIQLYMLPRQLLLQHLDQLRKLVRLQVQLLL